MVDTTIVPDSSFYICFLDDINKPQYLHQLLECNAFRFITGSRIKEEVSRSSNYKMIEKTVEIHVQIFMYYNYGEILRPFFSLEEITRGEHEVIAIAYILHFLEIEFTAILDDDGPKKFLQKNFPKILTRVTGTVGFIKLCCSRRVFSKEEAISILVLIKNSKFRVRSEIVDETIEEIRRS